MCNVALFSRRVYAHTHNTETHVYLYWFCLSIFCTRADNNIEILRRYFSGKLRFPLSQYSFPSMIICWRILNVYSLSPFARHSVIDSRFDLRNSVSLDATDLKIGEFSLISHLTITIRQKFTHNTMSKVFITR